MPWGTTYLGAHNRERAGKRIAKSRLCVKKKRLADDNFLNLNWNVDYIISSDSLREGGV